MKSLPALFLAPTLAALLFAVPARADSVYDDADSSYLKVTATFLQPVGQLLEWIVFRPIHVVHHAIVPSQNLEGRPARRCTSLRPSRDCARR